jgi:hypothetical protein
MGLGYSKVEPDRSSEVLVLYLKRPQAKVAVELLLNGRF